MKTWTTLLLAGALSFALAGPVGPPGASAEDETPPDPTAVPLTQVAWVDAPVEDVWRALTTSEGWKKLGVAMASVDFRVGGKILSRYTLGGRLGDEKTIENTILAYEPQRMLAIRATKAPVGFPFPAAVLERTWSTFHLTDLGGGRTRLVVRGYGYGSDEDSQRMRAFFERGNEWTMKRLADALAVEGSKQDPSLSPIEITTVVRGAPDEVFAAWTTEEGVRSFLGVECRIDLSQGGPYEIYFTDGPEGQRGSEGCVVQTWLPGRLLAFSWNAPPAFAHCRGERTRVVVALERESEGTTRVWLTHEGFADHAAAEPDHADEWKAVRAYFARAWPSVLAALKAWSEE